MMKNFIQNAPLGQYSNFPTNLKHVIKILYSNVSTLRLIVMVITYTYSQRLNDSLSSRRSRFNSEAVHTTHYDKFFSPYHFTHILHLYLIYHNAI